MAPGAINRSAFTPRPHALGQHEGFCDFVAALPCRPGSASCIDWVPAHFPTDEPGLAALMGTHFTNTRTRAKACIKDWGTLIYNFGRREVFNYLIGNALFWIEHYGVDGLRVTRWLRCSTATTAARPESGCLTSTAAVKTSKRLTSCSRMNEVLGSERPGAATYAEESTAWPSVSRPPSVGGLGFHYKWNMGWMHDMLDYMTHDPIHRRYHHNELTFGLLYAFTENFVLPLSHDEVVHGKGSLIGKMPGDYWQKFANLRTSTASCGLTPARSCCSWAASSRSGSEWNDEGQPGLAPARLPTARRRAPPGARSEPAVPQSAGALHEIDFDPSGFEWIRPTIRTTRCWPFSAVARTAAK